MELTYSWPNRDRGKMRRRERRECGWTGGTWVTNTVVRYVYDGNLVIQERHYAPQGSTLIPQEVVSYTRGKDLSGSLEGAGGIGGLLARSSSSDVAYPHAYYHADGNGNVTALVSANQVLVAQYVYDPYGNILGQNGPLADVNLYRFSSKEFHANSGLVYYLYRFYEPNLQRWMNRDPIGEMGGYNLCSFVSNQPISEIDSFGLQIVIPFPGRRYPPLPIVPPNGPYPIWRPGMPHRSRAQDPPQRGTPAALLCLGLGPVRQDFAERCNLNHQTVTACIYYCPGTQQYVSVSRPPGAGWPFSCEEDMDIPVEGRF